MTFSEIVTIIASLLSVAISSGAVVALLQLRASNRKLDAESKKTEQEAQKLTIDEQILAFKTQMDTANSFILSLSNRLSTLTNRLVETEKIGDEREKRINDLESSMESSKADRIKLRNRIKEISHLLEELLIVTHKHIDYHVKVLESGLLPDFPEVSANLIKDTENIEVRFKNIMDED